MIIHSCATNMVCAEPAAMDRTDMAIEDYATRNAHLTKIDRAYALGLRAGESGTTGGCPFGEGPEEKAWRRGYARGQQLVRK